jgi:hypothetical protein
MDPYLMTFSDGKKAVMIPAPKGKMFVMTCDKLEYKNCEMPILANTIEEANEKYLMMLMKGEVNITD